MLKFNIKNKFYKSWLLNIWIFFVINILNGFYYYYNFFEFILLFSLIKHNYFGLIQIIFDYIHKKVNQDFSKIFIYNLYWFLFNFYLG